MGRGAEVAAFGEEVMAIVRTFHTTPKAINETNLIEGCELRYDSTYYKFRNFFYRADHEADLFVVSKSRYATEIEVKTSLADWKNDFKKKKHQTLKWIKYFYYAVPEELADKIPDEVDPRYGIIACSQAKDGDEDNRIRTRELRPAQDLKLGKVPSSVLHHGFYGMYWKYRELLHEYTYVRSCNELLNTRLKQNEVTA